MPTLRDALGMWGGKLSGRVPVSHQDALHEVLGSRTGKSRVSTGKAKNEYKLEDGSLSARETTYFWTVIHTFRRLIRSTQGGDRWPILSRNPVSGPKILLVWTCAPWIVSIRRKAAPMTMAARRSTKCLSCISILLSALIAAPVYRSVR